MCRHHQDAEDLAQDFISKMLDAKTLASFDRSKCERFRHFLKATLRNFFRDWWDKQNAEKRGGGKAQASLDELQQAGQQFAADDDLPHPIDLQIVRLTH